ncbi:hypothetical protein QVD17_21082 [Tagetes erecta]|uniref:Uncharacterized protein n=1 Tax=Tagetes erecta TaxID=13708 RepID=A0AAD8KSV4_TARER|nr:hypothetical protein QVD17_21082 [Tagetes erecta]
MPPAKPKPLKLVRQSKDEISLDEEDVNANVDEEDAHVTPNIDIFDPRCWDGLGQNMINMLVKNGPKRDLTIVNGPVDKRGRRSILGFTNVNFRADNGDGSLIGSGGWSEDDEDYDGGVG